MKTCVICNKILERRTSSYESPTAYAKRKTCSRECADKDMKINRKGFFGGLNTRKGVIYD